MRGPRCLHPPALLRFRAHRGEKSGFTLGMGDAPAPKLAFLGIEEKQVEDDLRGFVEARFDMPIDKLTWQCEQAVRNYDPCISRATHAVRVRIERD